MKLVVFGLTVSSSWGNGHATLWRGLIGSLAALGHRVVFFERDVPYYASARDLTGFPGGQLVLYDSWSEAASLGRSELADADAAMVTSYCPDGIEAAGLLLASPVPVRVFYDLDTPVTLDRLGSGAPVPYLSPSGLGDFDLVLSYTGGAALDALRTRLGARRVAPLYGSVDPSAHRPVQPVAAFAADLSYLGTYAADRQLAVETLFVEPARRLPSRRFLLGGAQYPPDFPWADNIYFVRHLPPADHPAFFSSSRLTLNVTRAPMASLGYCPSGRLFEAAACGAPILTDRWAGLEEFFVPGEELLVADSTDDVVASLAMDDAVLRRIGRAGRARALRDHTADRRAAELIALLESAASVEA